MPKRHEKETITADTSALISLSVGSIIKDCLEVFSIVIPASVQYELEEMSEYKDKHAQGAAQVIDLISNEEIEVKKLKQDDRVSRLVKKHPRLDAGETETLLLAEENSISIMITDDFKSLSSLKELSEEVKIHLSIYPIARLLVKDKIDREKAEKILDMIAEERSWEGAAIYGYAKRYIDEL